MKTLTHESTESTLLTDQHTVLELTVNNHPGVMSHICGLFSRRAYNMDRIICMSHDNGQLSSIWLRVKEENRLEQVVKQLQKLEDVLDINYHDTGHGVSISLEHFFSK